VSYIDPLKVVRNPETLKAYRDHQRAARTAGQPWFGIGLVLLALDVGLLLFALFRGGFGNGKLYVIFSSLTLAYGLCLLIAGVRTWLFRRSHPLVLPEPPSPMGTRANVG
jgi:hypothetical protein